MVRNNLEYTPFTLQFGVACFVAMIACEIRIQIINCIKPLGVCFIKFHKFSCLWHNCFVRRKRLAVINEQVISLCYAAQIYQRSADPRRSQSLKFRNVSSFCVISFDIGYHDQFSLSLEHIFGFRQSCPLFQLFHPLPPLSTFAFRAWNFAIWSILLFS